MLIGIIIGISIVALLIWAANNDCFGFTLICLLLIGAVTSCNQSERYQAYSKEVDIERAKEAQYNATPHVIREADGCKVYTFKAGEKWHYFTRCQATTVTEAHSDEKCGKNKVCDTQETITTEVKK